MRRNEIEKAAQDAVVSKLWRGTNNGTSGNGLSSHLMAKALPVADRTVAGLHEARADGSERRSSWANMTVPLRSKRCGGGSPQQSSWRMIAAPALTRGVAFLFGGIRTHGLIVPALYRFCGLMPCGKPSGLPFPIARLLPHPHGVALPVEGESGIRQFAIGVSHE